MNTSKSSRCLLCKWMPSAKTPTSGPRQRKFHTTPSQQQGKYKPAYPSVKAADMGLLQKAVDESAQRFRPYTPREKQLLALKYTPQQLKAIEAGEAAIDPKDLVVQGKWRSDPMALNYIDDLSKIEPIVDKPLRAPDTDIDPNIRMLSDEETAARFARHMDDFVQKSEEFEARQMGKSENDKVEELRQKMREVGLTPGNGGTTEELLKTSLFDSDHSDGLTPQQRAKKLREVAEFAQGPSSAARWEDFLSNANNFFHSPRNTLASQSDSLAPEVPKMEDTRFSYPNDDEDPVMERLTKQTGLSAEAIKKIRVKNLVCHRVVNQTRMGKIQSMYFLSVAGNEDGMLGIGEGKAADFSSGRTQAMVAAIRNMKPIPRYENRTIFGEVQAKVGASVVQLSARPPGFGNRGQHLIYEIGRAAGISDLSAKCLRSRNKMNVCKATFAALLGQKLPEDVAKSRGRKVIDVRKVYYQGSVH